VSKNKRPIPQIPQGNPNQNVPPRVPSANEIAKNNILQTMNSVGSIANNMLQASARYMGASTIAEHDVDHAIEIAQWLVYKMNAITTEELRLIDEEEDKDEDDVPVDKIVHGGVN